MNQKEIIEYINGLTGYEGYIQFSHRPIDIEKDVFIDQDPNVKDEEGFILEAHFFDGSNGVTIRQINDEWVVDENKSIVLNNVNSYYAVDTLEVNMAQIWTPKRDKYCADFEVLKLEKVVFVGFKKESK
jgi:CRISPR type III-associated protein (TIGR04423 family)